jgi:hypothetical protein
MVGVGGAVVGAAGASEEVAADWERKRASDARVRAQVPDLPRGFPRNIRPPGHKEQASRQGRES